MIRLPASLLAIALLTSAVLAATAQLPIVLDSAGKPVQATAYIPVDTTGAYAPGANAAAVGQTDKANSLPVTMATDQPPILVVLQPTTQITISATGTTGATVATLAATSGKTTYICGFSITSDATALIDAAATVSGVVTGTMTYLQTVGAVASGASQLNQTFSPCLPANASNTTIVVTSAAAGTGGHTNVNAWGYQQ